MWTLTYVKTHTTFAAADADRVALLASLSRSGDPAEEYRVRVRKRGDRRFDVIARRRAANTKPRTATGSKTPVRPRLTIAEKLERAAQTAVNVARYYATLHAAK